MQNVHSKWQDGDDLRRWRGEDDSGWGGANRNDAGTLTSNKLNGGPPRQLVPRRNAIKYRINTGVRLYMSRGGVGGGPTEGERAGWLAGWGKYYPAGPISSAWAPASGSVLLALANRPLISVHVSQYTRNILEIQRQRRSRCDRTAAPAAVSAADWLSRDLFAIQRVLTDGTRDDTKAH